VKFGLKFEKDPLGLQTDAGVTSRKMGDSSEDEQDKRSESSSSSSSSAEEQGAKKQPQGASKEVGKEVEGDDDDEDDDDDDNEEEEDDDDDDDDEGEEESAGNGKKRKKSMAGSQKRKKQKGWRSMFEEEAADDDDEEEELEAEREYLSGKAKMLDDDEDPDIKRRYEERQRQAKLFQKRSIEEIAQEYEEKEEANEQLEYQVGNEQGLVDRKQFLPTRADPKLFMVRCKKGDELRLCIQIMNKYRDLEKRGKAPRIFSALSAGTPETIYVEARTKEDVDEALYGLRGVYRTKTKLVPLLEMVDVLKVAGKKYSLKVGDFVRMRRFPYKGDLAKVVRVSETEAGRVVVQCIPRIDKIALKLESADLKAHKASKMIPSKAFFESSDFDAGVVERKMFEPLGEQLPAIGSDFFKDGFLVKDMNERMLQTKDVKPTLEEIQSFRRTKKDIEGDFDEEEEENDVAREEDEILETIAREAGPSSSEPPFTKGDIVIVKEGELQNLKAEVVAVNNITGEVTIDPLDAKVRGSLLDFPPSDLSKYFEPGNHVKVVSGKYAGETGTVVKIVNDEDGSRLKAIVFTDSSTKELSLLVEYLKLSEEVAQSKEKLGGYSLLDLVSLGTQVGVIVKIGTETLDLLMQTGNIRTCGAHELRSKLNSKSQRSSAMDSQRNTIGINSAVKVVAGENAGLEATVKHIHRSFLFLHSKMRMVHAGIFVERARNVQLAGVTMRNASGLHGGGLGSFGGGRGGPRPGRNDDPLVGKSVQVKKGKNKGYIGIVLNTTEHAVKVEIHSKKRIADVPRDHVFVVGDEHGRRVNVMQGNFPQGISNYQELMGGFANATPMHPPHTPAPDNVAAWNANTGLEHSSTPGPGTPGPGTPGPGTPGATGDSAWDPNRDAGPAVPPPATYSPPETPAGFPPSSSYSSVATPAALPQTPAGVPQTPGTVPQTPGAPVPATPTAAPSSSTLLGPPELKLTKGTLVRALDTGEICVLETYDNGEWVMRVRNKNKTRILPSTDAFQKL